MAELEPSDDLLEVATRQQETTEARRYIDDGGSLEFGPEQGHNRTGPARPSGWPAAWRRVVCCPLLCPGRTL